MYQLIYNIKKYYLVYNHTESEKKYYNYFKNQKIKNLNNY